MSIPTELDRRAQELDKQLQEVLALFLLGSLSAKMAKSLADEFLVEAYISLIVYVRRQYEPPPSFNAEVPKLKKALEKIKQDFYD